MKEDEKIKAELQKFRSAPNQQVDPKELKRLENEVQKKPQKSMAEIFDEKLRG